MTKLKWLLLIIAISYFLISPGFKCIIGFEIGGSGVQLQVGIVNPIASFIQLYNLMKGPSKEQTTSIDRQLKAHQKRAQQHYIWPKDDGKASTQWT